MKPLDSRHLLAGLATALSAATCLVIAAGLLRWRMTSSWAFVICIASLAAGGAFAWRTGSEIFGPRPPAPPPSAGHRLFFALALAALAAYAFIIVPLWYRPDISWDAMAYHLPAIQFWTQRGYVHWVGSGDGLDIMW